MALFGGGALRKQIAALTERLEAARAELEQAKAAKAAAEKDAAEKDAAAKAARQDKKKADKKLDQIKAARRAAEKKASGLSDKLSHANRELAAFKKAMLESKNEAELGRARIAELEGELAARRISSGRAQPAPKPAPVAETPAPAAAADAPEAPPREERPRRRDDARVERMKEQLDAMRESNRGLKDKIVEAERAARNADRRRISDFDKAETVVRDLQHNLRSERRAYKILQLQYEAQIDRARASRAAPAAPEASPAS